MRNWFIVLAGLPLACLLGYPLGSREVTPPQSATVQQTVSQNVNTLDRAVLMPASQQEEAGPTHPILPKIWLPGFEFQVGQTVEQKIYWFDRKNFATGDRQPINPPQYGYSVSASSDCLKRVETTEQGTVRWQAVRPGKVWLYYVIWLEGRPAKHWTNAVEIEIR